MMCKIKVEKLTYGCAEVSFYEIRKAIEVHENLIVEYRGKFMEIGWESLASKFGKYFTPPAGIETWHFTFVPNYKEKNV